MTIFSHWNGSWPGAADALLQPESQTLTRARVLHLSHTALVLSVPLKADRWLIASLCVWNLNMDLHIYISPNALLWHLKASTIPYIRNNKPQHICLAFSVFFTINTLSSASSWCSDNTGFALKGVINSKIPLKCYFQCYFSGKKMQTPHHRFESWKWNMLNDSALYTVGHSGR